MTTLVGGTLAIDIGGTGLKAAVLDPTGKPVNERVRVKTPRPATPESVLAALKDVLAPQAPFVRVSCGFPGVVVGGVVHNAPNLDEGWPGFELAQALTTLTGKPARVANDADVAGLGVVEGRGVELVITLGTGVGSGLYVDGVLVPNLELGHHPFRKGQTYEEQLGDDARKDAGKKRWNERVVKMTRQVLATFNPRVLYLGGGNSREITAPLPEQVKIVDNLAGILGGIVLWRDTAE